MKCETCDENNQGLKCGKQENSLNKQGIALIAFRMLALFFAFHLFYP